MVGQVLLPSFTTSQIFVNVFKIMNLVKFLRAQFALFMLKKSHLSLCFHKANFKYRYKVTDYFQLLRCLMGI